MDRLNFTDRLCWIGCSVVHLLRSKKENLEEKVPPYNEPKFCGYELRFDWTERIHRPKRLSGSTYFDGSTKFEGSTALDGSTKFDGSINFDGSTLRNRLLTFLEENEVSRRKGTPSSKRMVLNVTN